MNSFIKFAVLQSAICGERETAANGSMDNPEVVRKVSGKQQPKGGRESEKR